MSDAEWPVPEPATPRDPERRPAPLPRIEDLPVAEQGYDREKVQEAFDAFYRHAAQLDATLSTLEAVDVFQRTAAELRAELRSIRGSGWTVQSWQGGYGGGGGAREWTLPPAFPRVAAEAVFLIVIGVVAGVAGWNRVTIVLVMALALGVVWLIEWVAARERAIPQATAPATPPVLDEEPAEQPALEGGGWVVPAEEGPEAMTMLGAPPAREADREEEAEIADDAVEAEALAEPELVEEPAAVEEPELVEEPAAVGEPELIEEPEAVEEPALVAEPEPVEGPVGQPDPVAEAEPEPEPAAEPAPEPELVAEPEPGPPPADEALGPTEPPVEPRRRFGLFRRRPVARAEPAVEEKPAEVAAPEAIEDELLDGARALEPLPEPLRAGAVDPWEQEPQLPVEPELEPEPEPEPEPGPEPEPEQGPEPEQEQEPELELELPSEETADEGPLPVEVLAEQAAAALERSRQRRALARRGRRR